MKFQEIKSVLSEGIKSSTVYMYYDITGDGEEEKEIEVTFEYWSAHKGYRNSMGVPEEPDEDAGFEIQYVECDGKEITDMLSKQDYRIIEDRIKSGNYSNISD